MSYEVIWIMLLKSLIVYYSAQTLNIFVKWKNKWRSEVKSGQVIEGKQIFSDMCCIFCFVKLVSFKGLLH